MNTSTVYRPVAARSARRLPRPGIRSLAAAALVVTAGSVTLDAMTPAAPVHHQLVLRYDGGRQLLCRTDQRGLVATVVGDGKPFEARCEQDGPVISTWNTAPQPHPAASGKAKHHILRKLLLPLRMVRHVHRFLRIARNPFSLRRWFW